MYCRRPLMKCFIFIAVTCVIASNARESDQSNGIIAEVQQHASDEIPEFHVLTPGKEKRLQSMKGENRLEIFCYKGESQSVTTIFKTVELVVKVPENNFYHYEGSNASSVMKQYLEQSWFSFSPWRQSSFRLNLYNISCIGIETSESFKVQLKIRYIDFWRLITLLLGICLFFLSPTLAHNILFHYMAGVSIGVFGSLLVIVFLLSRMVPKKTGAVTVLFGGSGLVLYVFQYLWTNCLYFMKEYQTVVVGYVALAGLLSFAVVYRHGPIDNIRSLQLVQWSLQLAALSMIFVCSQCKEFTVAVILILLAQHNLPMAVKMRFKGYWLKRFPPKHKFITEEDYLEQSRVETKKALEELKNFCNSPECNAWKTMSRLKSPERFAEFVEGSFHLADDEMMEYDSFSQPDGLDFSEDLMTSDEDDELEEMQRNGGMDVVKRRKTLSNKFR